MLKVILLTMPFYMNPVAHDSVTEFYTLESVASADPDAPVTYDEILDQAVRNCGKKQPETIDVQMLRDLIEVEKDFNVPASMRGMILAAACKESRYNPKAKGDRKFSKNKKTPMAIGLLQLWPIYEKMFPGLDRTDPIQSARAWMTHIIKQIPKVKRQCRYKTEKRIWIAAWVTGIRYKKPGGRCNEVPLHLRTLKKWHRTIKRERKKADGC